MRRVNGVWSAGAVAVVLAACVTGSPQVSPYGRAVTVTPQQRGQPRIAGELIAVSVDSLWVLQPTGLAAVPVAAVDQVRVKKHGFGGGTALTWTVAGALVTGGALTAACGSVEDADCGGVFPAVALSWLVIGGLAAASADASSRMAVRGNLEEQLRPYARFPQGLPDSLDVAALTPKPEGRRRQR